MLHLLCSSPRRDDYDYEDQRAPQQAPQHPRPTRRLSLPVVAQNGLRGSRKHRIQKMSISGPTDFVHNHHVGAAEAARRASASVPAASSPPPRPLSQPVLALQHDQIPVMSIAPMSRRASLPLSPSSPTSPVRRKAVPAYLDETASVSPFPSAIIHAPRQQHAAEHRDRPMVRLLDPLPEGRGAENPMLVTQTTKARFDGAMREIANALRDPTAAPR